jgi:hypothetical protein
MHATRLKGNDGILSRINELKTTIAAGVVDLDIRKCSARVQVLADQLDGMPNLQRARVFEYADHPGGSSAAINLPASPALAPRSRPDRRR